MKKVIKLIGIAALIGVFVACTTPTSEKTENQISKIDEYLDPLPSWNEGQTKTAIIAFVEDVTDETSPNFVAVEDRIATFDNDGNLWSEQPVYFQLIFAMDRINELAPDHPEWRTKQPYKAVLENDMDGIVASGHRGLIDLVMSSHAGMDVEEFDRIVFNWLATTKHPRFNQPYNALIYQPMLELINYLKEKEFKTFIVSGGGIEFMRVWVEDAYGIPKDQIIGSSIKTEFSMLDGKPVIMRLPEVDFNNDKEGKPIGIYKHIGRRPIFASGNSDGDLPMLQYTAGGSGKRFMLYVHHTDSVREWAYDRDSHIGRLDKGLDEAMEKGWTVIDMKKDWKVIYPFQLE